MVAEIDVRRDAAAPGMTGGSGPGRAEELARAAEAASQRLPGDHRVEVVSYDGETAGASVLVSYDAPPGADAYVARALEHLHAVGGALGLAPEQPPEFAPDPGWQRTSGGQVAVHLRQLVEGVPVYDATETVRFADDGRVLEVAGRSWAAPREVRVEPSLTAADALGVAARHLATPGGGPDDADGGLRPDPFGEQAPEPLLDLAAFDPHLVTAPAGSPDLPAVFTSPGLHGPVTVSLVWFPVARELLLGWHLRAQVEGGPEYRFVVSATDGRILLCRRLTRTLTGRASVVLRAGGPREEVTFPLDPASYGPPVPADLPAGWPDAWLVDATTSGSAVRAVNAAAGDAVVTGTASGPAVEFPPTPGPGDDDALVVNLFAFCSQMHDVLYLLGFREADGNFQKDSMGRGGRPNDAVLAKVHPGSVYGTANMGTRADGIAPLMNMGLVTSTGRHTALDPDVVFHEYTHGLTNRLVGGPMDDQALDAEQSGGLGEGWSDYVACTLLDKTVVGDWVVDSPAGIRRQPYTEDFTGTYAQLGTPEYSEVHDVGELWCAVLLSLGRALGRWETLQAVVDALKLTAANPSLLAARDAVLLAVRQLATTRGDDADAAVATAWGVFARYGMGPKARTDGATLAGIVADFDPPALAA